MNIYEQMNNVLMDDKNLIYKISKSYYELGLTQQEIADKFGISRIKVSRLLNKAVNLKIVEIKINPPKESNYDLEKILEEKYGLREVLVGESNAEEGIVVLDTIAKAASEYLIRILNGNETIALSWGNSIGHVVDFLPQCNFPDLKVVQMIGGIGLIDSETHGTEIVRKIAAKVGGKPRIIQSPGIVKSKALCEALKSEPQVEEALSLAKEAQIAIVGIGSLNEGAGLFLKNNLLSDSEIEYLNSHEVKGDISLHFFDKNGNYVDSEISERVVGLNRDQVMSIPLKIGIAGGIKKTETIRAALLGKWIDVLIVDKRTAQKLI